MSGLGRLAPAAYPEPEAPAVCAWELIVVVEGGEIFYSVVKVKMPKTPLDPVVGLGDATSLPPGAICVFQPLALGFSYTSSMNDNLELLSWVIGWAYFLSWSLSFYPQAILNYRRKRVDGSDLIAALRGFF